MNPDNYPTKPDLVEEFKPKLGEPDAGWSISRTMEKNKSYNAQLVANSAVLPAAKNVSGSVKLRLSSIVGGIALVTIVSIGSVYGFIIYSNTKKLAEHKESSKVIVSQPVNVDNLNNIDPLNLTDPSRTLVVNSSAVFNGTIAVKQDLNLSGKLISNGPLAVNSINVSGNTILANTAVNGSLTVKNALIAQSGLVLTGALSINGNISGSGSATFSGDVSANSFSAKNTFYSGNFTINGHFQSSGSVPSISANTGIIGSGANVSIVGNDTSGFITVRIGANPSQLSAGTMANITFRTAYNNGVTPRVVLTPADDKAALLHYYVVATNTSFQLRSADILPANTSNEYSFYYVTMQ